MVLTTRARLLSAILVPTLMVVGCSDSPEPSGDAGNNTVQPAPGNEGDATPKVAANENAPDTPRTEQPNGTDKQPSGTAPEAAEKPRLSVAERLARVEQLGGDGAEVDGSLPHLLRMLDDPDVEVRMSAEEAIGGFTGNEHSFLLELGFSSDEETSAMKPIVAKLREEGAPITVQYLTYSDDTSGYSEVYGARRWPTFVLFVNGRVEETTSGRVTEERLRSLIARLPEASADAPGLAPESKLLVTLLDAGSRDPWLRRRGRAEVEKLRGDAADSLLSIAADAELPDTIRTEAVRAYSVVAADISVDAAETLSAMALDEDLPIELRTLAAGTAVDAESAPEVKRVLRLALLDRNVPTETKMFATQRMGEAADPEAAAALLRALKSGDADLVLLAAQALEEADADPKTAVPALIAATAAADYRTQYEMREVLEDFAGKLDAVPESVIDDLKSGNSERIEIAMMVCQKIGDLAPARPILEKLLESENEESRLMAARLLATLPEGSGKSLEVALTTYLRDPDSSYQAMNVLSEAGGKAVTLLIEKLEDEDLAAEKKAAIARLIGYMDEGASRAAPQLRAFLESENDALRFGAAIALTRIATVDEKTAAVLLDGLKNGDDDQRSNCADGLSEAPASDEVVAALFAALDDTNDSVRYSAGSALRSKIRPKDVDQLEKQLADPEKATYVMGAVSRLGDKAAQCTDELAKIIESNPDLADSAVYALGSMGEAAVPALAQIVDSDADVDVRSTALGTLGEQGEAAKPVEKQIVGCLDDESLTIRVRAAAALAALGNRDERLAGILVDGLADSGDGNNGWSATMGLQQLGEEAAPAVPRIIKLLDSEDPEVAERAASALQRIGGETEGAAAAYLDYVLEAEDEEEFESRAYGLSRFGDKITPRLVEMLDDESADKRFQSAKMLISITPRFAYDFERSPIRGKLRTALLGRLDDEEARVAQMAAVAISPLDPPVEKVVPHLVGALDSKESNVVNGALRAIATIGDPASAAVPKILELVEDEEYAYSAVNALSRMEGAVEKSFDKLLPLLDDEDTFDTVADLIASSGGEKAKEAIPALEKGLDNERTWYSAAYALNEIGDDASPIVAKLAARLDDDSQKYVACRALGVLGELDPETGETALRKALQSDDPQLRAIAASGLSDFLVESDETREALIAALDDDSIEVKQGVISALGQFGAQASEAVPKLIEALDHERLRYATVDTLSSMGEAAAPAMPKLAKLLEDDESAEVVVYSFSEFGEVAKPIAPSLVEYAKRNPDIRSYVRRILLEIDPEAAKSIPNEE